MTPKVEVIQRRALSSVAAADMAGSLPTGTRKWDQFATPRVITGYLFGDRAEDAGPDSRTPPLDALAIRTTTAHLMELDFQLGGGHTRELLLFYFRSQVLPMFDSLPRGTRRDDLLSATGELAQMLGWSAYDAGHHAASQRYLVHGLRLAKAAGDVLLGARLLSNLSHQANYLGHFRDSVQLARAAISTAERIPAPDTVAMLHSMEARALASLGDRRGTAAALAHAESAIDRDDRSDDPEWIGYFNLAELAGEAAHCFRDLGVGEETRHFAALAVEPADTPARTRAFINMVTAAGALRQGSLDEAVTIARHAIELAGPLQSSRYRRYVSDFVRQASDAHPRDPRTMDLTAFTSSLLNDDRSDR